MTRIAIPVLMTLFVGMFRIAGIEYPVLLNVTPVFALFLCFPKECTEYLYIPVIGYVLSDVALNISYNAIINPVSLLFTVCFLLGTYFFGKTNKLGLAGKAFTVSTAHFLITSTIAWAANPAYGSGAVNWFNAVVSGMPEYPPAYLFYINSLIGNLGFCFLFEKVLKLSPIQAKTC